MTKTYAAKYIARALVLSFLVTGVLLLVMAFLMYKFGMGEKYVNMGIIFTYIFSSAVGGLVIGKGMKQRKFIWGCIVGIIYVSIICVVSVISVKGNGNVAVDGLSTLLLCMGGGMLGGMIS